MAEKEYSLTEVVRLLRWLVPLPMALFGAAYPIIEHLVVQQQPYATTSVIRTSLILGSLGPALMWVSLTWLLRAVTAREGTEKALARRNRELSALNAIACTVGASLDLQTILDDALDQIVKVVEVEAGEVFLLEPSRQAVVMAAHRGPSAETLREIECFPLGEGFPGRVAQTGRPLMTTELARDLRFLRRHAVEAGFGSYACVPLWTKSQVVGVLSVAALGQRPFSSNDLDLLTSIGAQLGLAIVNARLFEHGQKVAMLEERDRLARDMHDGLAQTLGFLTMKLDTAQTHLVAGQAQEAQADLGRMKQVIGQAYEDLREAIIGLKETARPGVTLESLIRERLSRLYGAPGSDDGVTVELITAPEWADGLSPRATAQIAEIVREALTNVYKHAQARHAWVRLNRQGTEAQIVVEDDGRGLPGGPSEAHQDGRPHFGLTGMRERAESIGGRLTVNARPGGGIRVSVAVELLPIKASFTDHPPSD